MAGGPRRGTGARWAGAAVLAALLAGTVVPASAVESDRLAVERLAHETPLEAALSYLDACYRIGVIPAEVRPVQAFQYRGVSYVRLDVAGSPMALRCLNGLAGRRGVDGTIRWFDGFAGGQLLPGASGKDRIPDSAWYRPGATLPAPPPDASLVDALAQGSAAARTALGQLPLDQALVNVGALAQRGGPGPLAVLEVVARTDSHWPVRVTAVGAIDPVLSAGVLMEAALHDSAWEVRLNAVVRVGAIAADGSSPRAPEAAALLVRIAGEDPDWAVQRQAVWSMSSAVVRGSARVLRRIMDRPATDPRVAAIILESLGGTQLATHEELAGFLHNRAPEPRAIAAELLAPQAIAGDAPLLWAALNDGARMVRLAAAPFLNRIDDPTIGPTLWHLMLDEADHVDAQIDFEAILLDAMERHPWPALPSLLAGRLELPDLAPGERRLLGRTLARVSPARARALFEPQLGSKDALARSIAADIVPDSPEARARRLALLADPESDVRAGALLGLCRASSTPLSKLLDTVELDPTPLGQEATAAVARCGLKVLEWPRIPTALAGPAPATAADGPSRWPAVAAIALLLASVLIERLRRSA